MLKMKDSGGAPALWLAMLLSACTGSQVSKLGNDNNVACPDTAVYGQAVRGSSKSMLLMVTDLGDTVRLKMMPYDVCDDWEPIFADHIATSVAGGTPRAGDRMTAVGVETPDGSVAKIVVNISSLYGKWSSVAGSFEICEGGLVTTPDDGGQKAWTEWKLHNCNLVLGTDTFAINSITPDALLLENKHGIYAYSRQ